MLKKAMRIILLEAIVLLCGAGVIAIGLGYCYTATITAGNLVLILLFLVAAALIAGTAAIKFCDKNG